jgi:zinc transporter ZupT
MNNDSKVNNEDHKARDSTNGDCLNGTASSAAHEMQMTTTEQCHRETIVYPHPDPDRGFVIQLTDHHHHHQRQAQSVRAKSVIYMVITGDGLHNFCDGIAIGVAFAGSGLSGGQTLFITTFIFELNSMISQFSNYLKYF